MSRYEGWKQLLDWGVSPWINHERLAMATNRAVGTDWKVQVHGVVVDFITDEDYQAICRNAYRDGRLWVVQIGQLLWDLYMGIVQLVFWLPAMLLWIPLGWALLDPTSFTEAFAQLRAMPPEHLVVPAWSWKAFEFLAAAAVLVRFATGDIRWGSVFEQQIKEQVLRHCEIPFTGSLTLSRCTDHPTDWPRQDEGELVGRAAEVQAAHSSRHKESA